MAGGATARGGDRAFRRRLTAARVVLTLETLGPALLPGLGVAAVFAALAFAGFFDILPGTLHAILLGLFGLALILGWRRVPAALRLAPEAAARRRLEVDNKVPHRALEVLEDDLAAGAEDDMTAALWRLHRERAARNAGRLSVHGPRPQMARRDPWALRALVVPALVVAAVAAGPEAVPRLTDALMPRFGKTGPAPAGATTDFTAWITPPAYTRLPPLYLGAQGLTPGQALRVAAGSTVVARLYGVEAGRIGFGEARVALDPVEEGSFAGEVPVQAGTTLRLLDGDDEIAAWPLEVVADTPPEVAFTAPLSATERRVLRIAYEAEDDYGIAAVALELRLPDRPDVLSVPLGGGTGRAEAKGVAFRDLTAHPWAGLEVAAVLTARDALDQTGLSDPVTITLPEREFRHPVARAIVAARKHLVSHPRERRKVADTLADIASVPGAFGERISVYLGLVTSVFSLYRNTDAESDARVVDLLWEIALDLDEGRVPSALASLREAQEALEEALESGASDAEVARLMDELRRAMAEYLQALAMEAQRWGGNLQELQPIPGGRLLTDRDLQRMIDEAQRAAEAGSREAARQTLQNLREMLENLQAMQGLMQDNPAARAMDQGMQQLSDMLRRQGELRDQAFSEQQRRQGGAMPGGQNGQPRPAPGGDMSGLARDQEDLRRQLGEMLRQLGEAGLPMPDSLTEAERAMDRARGALEGDDPAAAAEAQGQALSALREGLQDLGEQMAQQLGLRRGQGQGAGQEPGDERDPLGRPRPGREFGSGNDVRVPTEAEAKRVREILNELQRRAGDRTRPAEELDYIRRLLDRF
ncbi:TIGR02302 family protein [Zavarzinia compransoris]|uniref:TIGR02302 family protein n=1 Tax=Zavarzinia marina TaxID=2911065 RepID=UPI001F1B8770|nr:TIGR02302 family protein [Zavarzinia marina]MCF4166725.1 TIGR02302 family protein [Zavarzinia marina]